MLSVFYFEGRNGRMPACRQTGKKKVRKKPIIDFVVRQLPDRSSSTIPCQPCLPAGRRQAGIIPIPYDKLVTNYNLEYYYHFLNRTDVT